MAINRRAWEKIESVCKDDENMREFLRDLLVFELDEPGRYKSEYERMLKDHADKDVKNAI